MSTKIVNGKVVELTQEEIDAHNAREAAWAADKPNRDLKATLEKRIEEYGSVGEQLDMIFHQGIDAWKAHIQNVKNKHPK